jgi:hypothetical protein
MMQNRFARRRVLLQALASVVLVSTSRFSFGQPDKAEAGKADGEAGKVTETESKGAAKKGKNAVLTVVVTGNDKLIAQAEVKVKFPPSVGGEATLPTDQAGEATFNSAGTGTAKVRVIVTGWESVLQDVTLKEGPQRLTIKLNSLPNAK